MAAPYLELDITRELEQLHSEPEWRSGQNAKTLVKNEDLRIVLTALKAHSRIPEHQTEDGSQSTLSRGISRCERKAGHSICRPDGCWRWTAGCRTMSRRSKTAPFC